MYNTYKVIQINDNMDILLNPETGFWTVLNYVASTIIKDFLGGINIENTVNSLHNKYEIDKKVLIMDVKNCIELFKSKLNKFNQLFDEYNNSNKAIRQLTIHITEHCNLNCPYCYKDSSYKKRNECMSIDTIIRLIETAHEHSFTNIVFSGGEPTIRKDFEILLNELSRFKNQLEFSLITNGTTELDDSVLELIVETFSNIQISIDSFDESKNSITRGKGSLDKVMALVSRFNALGYHKYYFACTPYTSNMEFPSVLGDLAQMLRFSVNVGGSGLYINQLKPDGRLSKEQHKKFDNEEFWAGIDKMYYEYGLLQKSGFNSTDLGLDFRCFAAGDYIQLLDNYSHKQNCGLGFNELCVNSDGNVYPCSALIEHELNLGNVLNDDFSNIIVKAKEKYNQINISNISNCNECDIKLICGGGCRAMAYYENNDLYSCDPNCQSCKNRIFKWIETSFYANDMEEIHNAN